MSGNPLYSYKLSGRRSAMVFVLIVSTLLLAIAAIYAAPWYFLLPVCFSGSMALWAIIANPKSGSTLTKDALHFYNRSTREVVQIKEIVSMTITNWTDGPDTVTLHLISGGVVHVPSLCADSQLAVALRDLGVAEN